MPLLPGETVDSDLADDAEHWMAVYEELTRFLDRVASREDAVERFRSRLEYWRGRRDAIGEA